MKTLSPEDVARLLQEGARLVDARDRVAFAHAHVPGSINIELDSSFGTYVGWVTPFDAPLVLLLPEPVSPALTESVTQLIRIGYERVVGFAEGGLEAWRSRGRPVRTYPTAGVDDLCNAYLGGDAVHVLDVRQPVEWDTGYVPGSLRIHLGDLPARLADGRAIAKCGPRAPAAIAPRSPRACSTGREFRSGWSPTAACPSGWRAAIRT